MGLWNDSRTLLASLTPRRAWNASQVLGSYWLSRANGNPTHAGWPISMSIEPTTSCNLRCPECPSGLRSFTRPTGMLSDALFQRVIDEVAPTLTYLTFYFQGEPYLHPQFLPMVRYATERGIYTATSTNAHFLNEEQAALTVSSGLKRLIISIDGTTQDTYSSYRVGGSLDKVITATRNMVAARKSLRSATPQIVFQFLVVRQNEHQVPEVYRLARELGVDRVVLKTAQIYDFENGSPFIPTIDKYARYRQGKDNKYTIKNPLESHCWKMWHSCVVTWDGKVVPCCFDKDAQHVMGDLHSGSFEEIWNGTRYRNFRTSLLKARKEIDICKNCSEGTRVWA